MQKFHTNYNIQNFLSFKNPFSYKRSIYRCQTKAFSDQFLSILSDSYYSSPLKKDINARNQKLSKNYFMSCKENRIVNNRSFYSSFYLGPFDSGQSITVANALRRTLLAELSGLAITAVEIEGVTHEYSTIPGVKDTVLDILLNLKEIVIKSNYILEVENGEGFLQVRGPGVIRASDIRLPSYLLCVDPDQYIATLSADGVLSMKFTIDSGKSYLSISKESLNIKKFEKTPTKTESSQLVSEKPTNLLILDPIFSPVSKVNYIVEQNPQDFSSQIIILEIWTNGSLHPRKALYDALKKLINIFSNLKKIKIFDSSFKSNKTYTKIQKLLQSTETKCINGMSSNSIISNPGTSFKKTIRPLDSLNYPKTEIDSVQVNRSNNVKNQNLIKKADFLQTEDLAILNLSVRSYNSLKNAQMDTINDLLNYSIDELLNKKIGKHVLLEVQKKLRKKGYFLK
uniref:DNA-directed RNA polymerase n=1 Tax=Carteria sp. SAG 8-5 TaxID=1756294 RepID=A0A0S2LPW2_9CHLO|nr:alpha subunit of RNA polymerase [Carteria sp. SAG 8-5]